MSQLEFKKKSIIVRWWTAHHLIDDGRRILIK